jgi:hypothetical protein
MNPLSSLVGVSAGQLRRIIYWLLFAEAALFTFMRNEFGNYGSPALLYLTAILACAAVYMYTRRQPWLVMPAKTPRAWAAVALASVLGAGLCVEKLREAFHNFLVQISTSDIIPALSIYTKRFLSYEEVYAPFVNELGYPALPTYLPATWFPYLLPEWLQLDYRWMSIALLAVGVAAYQWLVLQLRRPFYDSFLLATLPFALTYAIARTDPSIFGYTVESMIVGYYMLLIVGVLLRSWPLQALALVLCLLSRFSLVFWVPLYLLLVFFQESRTRAIMLAGTVGLGIVLLYIVPFLSHDWSLFMRVQNAYTDVAVGEWKHLNDQGLPYHLYNGVGLGNLFYHYWPGDLVARIKALKTLHLVLLVLITVSAGIVYWRQSGPRTDYRVFAIIVLKLYLATFYVFLQVPYAYLASVSIFASLFLVLLVTAPATPKQEAMVV